jgi:hypothetical protein
LSSFLFNLQRALLFQDLNINIIFSLGGYTILTAKFSEKNDLKFMELQCKVNLKKIESTVSLVKEFYFFYQPDEQWPNARVILAGLVRDKALWVDPYRVRMFPQLRLLVDKAKGMIWRGISGKGKSSCLDSGLVHWSDKCTMVFSISNLMFSQMKTCH